MGLITTKLIKTVYIRENSGSKDVRYHFEKYDDFLYMPVLHTSLLLENKEHFWIESLLYDTRAELILIHDSIRVSYCEDIPETHSKIKKDMKKKGWKLVEPEKQTEV